ncbi:MAG: patatin-like phospholipase family protein [Acidimicrobiia bacterium]
MQTARIADATEPDELRRRAGRDGFALVLGGGGAVGIAYHAGVLRALEEVGGIDIRRAKVMIGTSAGAVVSAQLRLGHSYADMVALAGGHDEGAAGAGPQEAAPRPASAILNPAWQSRAELYRRMVASTWSISRVVVRTPLPRPPRVVQRLFPPGLFSLDDDVWADNGFPEEWPDGELWLVTLDIDSGRRVVIKRPRSAARNGTLRQGIAASTAVPALYPPVHIGKRRLIDGGVHSPTNLDLAVRTGCSVVIASAPMAFDPARPPGVGAVLSRNRFNNQLQREAAIVRRAGAEVLLIRPSGDELRHHGVNLLRRSGNDAVMFGAYESTAAALSSSHAHMVLAKIRALLEAERPSARRKGG